MSSRIQTLPQQLACQIAAGEVIERPASVVKELLENSLDAGASRIQVDIEAAGTRLIRVRDNGAGIHADDLALALAPHSTSKLRAVADLAAIRSLGFRGEALASIAACARLRLISGQSGVRACEISAEPGAVLPAPAPAAHPAGTTIEVRDLFFNVPARRKFLRAEQTEFLHILELIKAFSLARSDLGLKLSHNGRTVFSISAGADLLERVATVFGRGFAARACRVDVADRGLQLSGIAGQPATARSQADRQYLFLNGRLIRDRRLNHALRLAYSEDLGAGRHAPLLLYLTMDAGDFDVNVHPTKHEVRFRAARDVHDFLYSALRQALADAVPAEQPDAAAADRRTPATQPAQLAETAAPAYTPAADNGPSTAAYLDRIGQYLLARSATGLLVVDARAAIEQLTRLELQQAWRADNFDERPLLLPQTRDLDRDQVALVEAWQTSLAALAIRLELTAPNRVALRALPKQLPVATPVLLSALLARLAALPGSDWQPALFDCLAQHAGAEFEQVLTAEPPAQLLQRLQAAHAGQGLETMPPWRELEAAQLAAWMRQS
ncbi:DNA mismatch repair protein MutL [Methylohalomonas lacus]|uniref:DNA mismatch repair protein MutL n=1 Tax=Methylohalomonas lacus TaxID=398773 RepID=A0AAE3HHJ5_9GAMM|nr:DNA mismatch repair endonuclease MutL [Methylohalomonas lacus]MCS3902389.1 DNA mismatch repair protein MutL [Methylohalomonas lacus]